MKPFHNARSGARPLRKSPKQRAGAAGLCPGSAKAVFKEEPKNPGYEPGLDWAGRQRPRGVKRIRIECSVCKRRLMSSVEMAHDNVGIIHSIPPHKPKGWWKRRRRAKSVQEAR